MLLTSVIIVLREVLEAALLISILSALSGKLGISRHWVGWALGLGMAGAVVYSLAINSISDWFDGVGQEVSSAVIQLFTYLLLLAFTLLVAGRSASRGSGGKLATLFMASAVSLAVTREGFEVLIYIYGFAGILQQLASILMGSMIGAGIGISVGALLYYLVAILEYRSALVAGICLLALVGAGMISQAILLLTQADWLPSQYPLWDTSVWLPENSVTGQLLYALIGYEATPTTIQAVSYFGSLLLLLIMAAFAGGSRQSPA
ncbi:MAG: FTR1 family protein [Gammaproteobacteria bacterium]|jgi:high-affinity iron transporter